jgi:predicted site-specific integrase-resolvase
VENKDRLTRFGFNYIETMLTLMGKKIIVVNKVDDDKTDLIQDLVSIIYSFSARIYGLRKKKNKQEIIEFLNK